MSARSQRRVRHAHFRCQTAEQAPRGKALLEDALRTASFVDHGRLVLIRKLDLGRLPLRAGPTVWSRRIEQRVQSLAAGAVWFADPASASATAVWFPDDWSPALELAVRLVRGQDVSGWFWRTALPQWNPGEPRTTALRGIFRQLAEHGLAATLALARRLEHEGALTELLAALEEDEVAALVPPPSRSAAEQGRAEPLTAAERVVWAARPGAMLARWAQSWGARSRRFFWLLAAMSSAKLGAAETPEVLWSRVAKLADRFAQVPLMPTASAAPVAAAPALASEFDLASRPLPDPALKPLPVDRSSASAPEWPPHPTMAGGLLFTLSLLARLGWPHWLAESDCDRAAAVTWHFLNWLVERLRVPGEDPIHAWLASLVGANRSADVLTRYEASPFCRFAAPQLARAAERHAGQPRLLRVAGVRDRRVLVDGSGRLPLATWRGGRRPEAVRDLPVANFQRSREVWPATIEPLLAALALGLHRVSWRTVGLGLRPLVRRSGWLSWTETHVDFFFTHAQADPRIRRAALDVDPGWVPWLERVVTFHYLDHVTP